MKLDKTKARQSEIRQTAAGAAYALGTWLENKFATITEATGYCVSDVDTIVDKIATRDEVMAEMHASREEKKRRLKELAAQKKVVEQELIDIRAQFHVLLHLPGRLQPLNQLMMSVLPTLSALTPIMVYMYHISRINPITT